MSVSGLCQVCESAEARDRCDRCGSFVCGDHFDAELGFCSSCAAEARRQGPGSGQGSRPEYDDTLRF